MLKMNNNIFKSITNESSVPYKIEMEYNVQLMNRITLRKYIFKIKEIKLNPDGSMTTEMIKAEREINLCTLATLRKYLKDELAIFFKNGIAVHSSDYVFWQCYVRFCKENTPKEVSQVYTQCLAIHNRPELWCDALSWAKKFTGNEEELNDIYQEACKQHPKSGEIYTTYFRIVLKEITLNMNRMSTLKKLYSIYKSAKTNTDSIAPIITILKQCEHINYCKFTIPIQQRIFKQFVEMETPTEEVCDALAQRELSGLNIYYSNKLSESKDDNDSEDIEPLPIDIDLTNGKIFNNLPMEQRIVLCADAYRRYVIKMDTKKMVEMSIDAMIKLNENKFEHAELKEKILMAAFKQGHQKGLMSEAHYVKFFATSWRYMEIKSFALEIIPIAVKYHNSAYIYISWIAMLIDNNKTIEILGILYRATRSVNSDAIAKVWKFVIQFFSGLGNDYSHICEKVLQIAYRYKHPAFVVFRPIYLQWCMVHRNIRKTRCHYKIMCRIQPKSYEVHRTMADIEACLVKLQNSQNYRRLRRCHENAIRDFGKVNIMVWINYLEQEKHHKGRSITKSIYKRAKKTLNPELVKRFTRTSRTYRMYGFDPYFY